MTGELLPHPATGELFPSPVLPGEGWPGDPADGHTPVAHTAQDVGRLADGARIAELDARISVCRACPRLVQWREDSARGKRRSFEAQPYWGRPLPGFGDTFPKLLIVGLAPAANGGNRTGRMFTGDQAGDWLFRSLHRIGVAAKPTAENTADGQKLFGARMVSAVRCAPPANKPDITERDCCAQWLDAEFLAVQRWVRVIVALGSFGWDASLRMVRRTGGTVPTPKPKFGHGARAELRTADGQAVTLLGCFHPSQQNTFTRKLTEPMLDDVLTTGRDLAGLSWGCGGSAPR
ncbi:uracil-DNA glycosylase [Rhodococcus sp. D2-41]|uniref:Type-5 uracil-DNA glycosylase n=1 Tax=Speluncibacter jeojiensis TaxID=2710754 RepID=A0A9X4RE41_9ACTN|nr:uracil-DNA glycosylase [Rhodococcus sp. D2-41]MDG3012677.1 uracil-DNA glycosylase [Rhodococcus sp. D2-41]MDG3015218.1 uracil-DNA glycosylase [Corynebacteriales bacterium D3-21]